MHESNLFLVFKPRCSNYQGSNRLSLQAHQNVMYYGFSCKVNITCVIWVHQNIPLLHLLNIQFEIEMQSYWNSLDTSTDQGSLSRILNSGLVLTLFIFLGLTTISESFWTLQPDTVCVKSRMKVLTTSLSYQNRSCDSSRHLMQCQFAWTSSSKEFFSVWMFEVWPY